MNLRDQILSGDDRKPVKLAIPEWGVDVYLRVMTGRERDLFETYLSRDRSKDIRARLACYTVTDADGNKVFTEADVEALSLRSGAALQRIFQAAMDLNAVSKADVEELAKNS